MDGAALSCVDVQGTGIYTVLSRTATRLRRPRSVGVYDLGRYSGQASSLPSSLI